MVDVLDLDRLVVLGRQVQGPRLQAQVDVLADQDHPALGLGAGEAEGGVQDPVVGLARAEDLAGVDAGQSSSVITRNLPRAGPSSGIQSCSMLCVGELVELRG